MPQFLPVMTPSIWWLQEAHHHIFYSPEDSVFIPLVPWVVVTESRVYVLNFRDGNGCDIQLVVNVFIDKDDDGFQAGIDCDDANAAINPGAIEIPGNGIDEDCRDGDLVSTVDQQDNWLRIFPNPVKEVLNIENSGNTSRRAGLTDILGEVVLSVSLSPGHASLSVGHLPAGVYYFWGLDDQGKMKITSSISIVK
ncbi:MAG: T9SS type A sorting domain-containing protein [Saprospiraceae bacterium]|nr:T9SS type A sorting domain-containing protein [Saprospiraceae bacterium]